MMVRRLRQVHSCGLPQREEYRRQTGRGDGKVAQYLGITAQAGPRMTNWDDIRFFLELARESSLSATARRLKVDHSTVARRISALERHLGVKLFDRLPRGYMLTGDGRQLLAAAEKMEAEALALQRQASSTVALHGRVRISAPPSLAQHFLAPRFAAFRARYPDVQIDLRGDTHQADLHRHEADLALRKSSPAARSLVARRLGAIGYGLYGARRYVATVKPKDWDFIGYNDSLAFIDQQRWMMQQTRGKPLVFIANDLTSLYHAARAGIGLTMLPHYIGGADSLLKRVPVESAPADWEILLVVHPDLRRTPRVRVVMDFLIELFERERQLLQGGEPAKHPALAKRPA